MTQQYKGDSFSPFLRSMKKRQSSREGEARVLEALGQESPLRVEELAERVNLSVLELAKVLESMQEAGLLVVEGPPGKQVVRLTPRRAKR